MLVVRLLAMVVWLGLVVVGAGCASPYLVGASGTDGESESDGSETQADSGASETGETDPMCGNGIVEAGESCDEQGATATCDEDCTPVDCGDGVVNEVAGEECDEGGATATCNLDCTLPRCGDGEINVEGEECDDGVVSAFCDEDCTAAECGDGVLNTLADEVCDDEGESEACDRDCTPVECGDGEVNEAAGEACDDVGESVDCNADCSVAACGDVITNVTAGEECDDGGESETCDQDCTPVECGDGEVNEVAGEACDDVGESVDCNADCSVAFCGDVITNVTAGEQCDDGGESATCNQDCTLASCGDGVVNVAAGEQCDGMGSTDACDQDCTLAGCGDGVVNAAAGEQCDDAGETVACDVDCTPVACGDALVNVTVGEACDGGGETAACNADCSIAFCGDGIVNVTAAEDCDDMGVSAACDVDCTAVVCGDATINALAGEICEVTDLVGETCEGFGYGTGTLVCPGCMAYVTSGCTPAMPVLSLSFSQVKRFDFGWAATQGAEYYQLLESPTLGAPYGQLGVDIVGTSASFEMPLHFRWQASYVLRACNAAGCTDSAAVDVVGSLAEAVGYVKASNTGASDNFGYSVALSGDGNTLAVGAYQEDSNATGIAGDQADNSSGSSGAVYVFTRNGMGAWSQQAYIKASNTGVSDVFGRSVALSGDGNTLAVGAYGEDSNATGIAGNQADNSSASSGAVYVFTRNGMGVWSQQAYVKASNTGADDQFGWSVALSGDGNTLAVGAHGEDSNATGVAGNPADNSYIESGAVYVFTHNGMGAWSQQAYVKASNTGAFDQFGWSVALSGDGNTLAVGASGEDSNATGIAGNQADNSSGGSGAVYVFTRNGMGVWSQQAYVKASNTGANDSFGRSVALSGDGNTLAVGAYVEDSNATGIAGNQADDSYSDSGAVYVFTRNGVGVWSQQAYVKASNTGAFDQFGLSVALSGDGNTLAVGAHGEGSNATGIAGNQADVSSNNSGAVYVFTRNGIGAWSQQAYVKASNTGASDQFGISVALSGDGNTLAVGAYLEDSNATGIAGNQADNSSSSSGAVYLY